MLLFFRLQLQYNLLILRNFFKYIKAQYCGEEFLVQIDLNVLLCTPSIRIMTARVVNNLMVDPNFPHFKRLYLLIRSETNNSVVYHKGVGMQKIISAISTPLIVNSSIAGNINNSV